MNKALSFVPVDDGERAISMMLITTLHTKNLIISKTSRVDLKNRIKPTLIPTDS